MGRSLTLAGDIGGTKAYLGIFRSDGEGICCLEEGRFPTARYSGVSELLLSFIETSGHRPERVVVGVPGPVRHPPVRPVNLPWTIDPVEIGERVFEHVLACASGEVQAMAEETGHREFQVWAERAVSL